MITNILITLRRYLLAGFVVWLPLWITLLVISFVVGLLDNMFLLLPVSYRPDHLFGVHIPGLGVILSLAILLGTGMIVSNYLGQRLIRLWESLMARIPLVRTIYAGVKKVLETLMTPGGQSFRKVLLVEYPRKGMWSVAFQTGNGSTEINDLNGEEMVSLFVPTTPNPTSGFLMMVPRADVREMSMSVDEALKFVISLGVLQPTKK